MFTPAPASPTRRLGLDGREACSCGPSVRALGTRRTQRPDRRRRAAHRRHTRDVKYEPRNGRAVLLIDAKADSLQEAALKDFAQAMAGKLMTEIAAVKPASMSVKMGHCATIKAGSLVEISTRCLGGKDHLCGNEENYYPPLTKVDGALAGLHGTGHVPRNRAERHLANDRQAERLPRHLCL